MQNKTLRFFVLALLLQAALPDAYRQARAQAQKAPYPAMAPLSQYLMPDEKSEIALARSAAPASISDGAEVMVLGRHGIHDRSERQEWLSLYSGTIMGRRHRSSGILESQSSRAHLL